MQAKRRILIAEDEKTLRNLVIAFLKAAGYEAFGASDGEQAIAIFQEIPIDLVILDVVMPKLDGFEVCQRLRQQSDVPIVILTALDKTEDVVRGFETGADDYITKPFTLEELKARIEAILRRVERVQQRQPKRVITIGHLQVDPQAHKATLHGQELHLTPMEFELLYFLMSRAGEAVSKDELFRKVWGYDFGGGANLVEVGVRRLREKVEKDPAKPVYIQTVRGVGYRFIESLD
ncbi:MAG: response regulator transcription factor [Candidatus Methanomethyliaceae archaeon]